MENDPNPDYEACFYNGTYLCVGVRRIIGLLLVVLAAKVVIATSNCRIIDSNGNTQMLSEETNRSDLPETTRKLLEHAQWVSILVCEYTDDMINTG